MRLFFLTLSLVLLPVCLAAGQDAGVRDATPSAQGITARQASSGSEWPIENDGVNDIVEWDHYSIFVNGKRLFLFTGEMHYWRIPVPEMWRDILEKIKAAGFTGFTFYSSWGYHAFNSTSVDFETGAHDVGRFFALAKEIGLYIVLRPGPYINAEANAGGFPNWLCSGAYGALRNSDQRYIEAYTPYLKAFAEAALPYLISNGGNGILYQIENEYGEQWNGDPAERHANHNASVYMNDLEVLARDSGIDVPLAFNNPNMDTYSWSSDFAPGALGNTDLSGVDSYPSCWTCDLSQCAGTNGPYVPYQVMDYYSYFESFPNTTQPNFLPEFQGGSFNPWGGPQGGCPADIGPDFANLFYRHNIAARVTSFNLYMMYGGTNWGSFATPTVATSYDYSAPISEDRSLWDKYSETKLLALFTRVASDLTQTDRLRNSTKLTTNPAVLTTELRNPQTNAAFYVTIHANSSSDSLERFKLHVGTYEGAFTIPQYKSTIALNGHQSKIIVTDFTFGNGHLVYSTAEVLSYIVTDGEPTLFLWVPDGEGVEFYLRDAHSGRHANGDGCTGPSIVNAKTGSGTIVSFDKASGTSVFTFTASRGHSSGKQVRVVVMDRSTAYTAWVPTLSTDPFAPANETVFVRGPYLVRSATLEGSTLSVSGDVTTATTIEVFAPRNVRALSWNGKTVEVSRTSYGSLKAQLQGVKQHSVVLPELSGWKSADSLPEIAPGYEASSAAWVVLSGWSAWLNGEHIGSFLGNVSLESGNKTLSLDETALKSRNTLTVVHDITGHDETPTYLTPRGILAASLQGGARFTSWKVAGTAGGTSTQLDPVRGALAEGGLYAERLGWHLPGFDDSAWKTSSPPTDGLTGPGIQFYRTVVPLSFPLGLDVSISFKLSAPHSHKLRAQLFVNGYQYGRFNPHIGNQVDFPVPPGVLHYSGNNTIGLAVWAQSEEGGQVGIDWKLNYVADSSLDVLFDGDYLRPGWSAERLQYA
ncbi:uncharacterized protein LTR77_010754 [Saxophila tyrrhenica]|uniref:beta-galactosidase n=1 Tax=Saxophila tyrrhenica TaxID=1690608 RepID=A0AAV9NY15_9PEZI|nr:hypothetical protein LTR77_010754 [Saxophila tyrrhenica]